ncbi:MAG TPA: nicotinate-nucleotide adenylyltransferase [Vicinamibacteria bacterium]|nr:nicotinate-nucleotide adenylyltransferase [Vicinamibacteria bacterium]
MKLGLLGGMFDPIHIGHLRAAEIVREALALDEVVFVPAGRPPHRGQPAAAGLDRYAMVALATAAERAFVPSDVELAREGPSYTVETVALIRKQRPGVDVVLIVGSDNLPMIADWREPERLLELCTVAVVERPGSIPAPAGTLPAERVHRVEGTALPIASRDLRERIRAGRSVRHLVPSGVADYIEKRGLYR